MTDETPPKKPLGSKPGRKYKQVRGVPTANFSVRMDQATHDALSLLADERNISVNAQINNAVRQYLARDKTEPLREQQISRMEAELDLLRTELRARGVVLQLEYTPDGTVVHYATHTHQQLLPHPKV